MPAGRPKGSRNKKAVELEALLAHRYPGWDPVAFLAEVATGKLLDVDGNEIPVTVDQRITCAKEVATYLRPKRKPVDDHGSSAETVRFELPIWGAALLGLHEPTK